MQVTKELIDNDIRGMEAQLEQLKAQAAQSAGALSVLRHIREFMDKPEPEVVAAGTEISAANKAVQDSVEAMSQKEISHALSEQELAELVAGPGASVESIEPIKVVNAQGKYEERVS